MVEILILIKNIFILEILVSILGMVKAVSDVSDTLP